ncbi:MAG: L,D-transpeptidase family protein [Chloroflexota bacterium]|nr:L,D-transpeptidase family protein [Chloroflexota bacterium]
MKYWTIRILVALFMLPGFTPLAAQADEPMPPPLEETLPFSYARIWDKPVPVFPAPGDPVRMNPTTYLLPPDSWVSIDGVVESGEWLWYRIDDGAYVLASDVLQPAPSDFQGVALDATPLTMMGFTITDNLNVRVRPSAVADSPPLRTLPRYSTINILGIEEEPDGIWYRIGPQEFVHGDFVRVAYPVSRPHGVASDERWIAVDLAEQTLSAYQGDRLVYVTMVSSGLPDWPTQEGLFRIWVKFGAGKMEGGSVEGGDYYYLQDVPWIMYFSREIGLHAAYWHDRFGTPRSHGCVNLSPRDALWLFNWATPHLPDATNLIAYHGSHNPGSWVYIFKSG